MTYVSPSRVVARHRAREVGTAGRLGEELDPEVVAPDHAREVPRLQLGGAQLEQRGSHHAQRHREHWTAAAEVVGARLVGERVQVRAGQRLAAVLLRVGDPGEAAFPEHALPHPRALGIGAVVATLGPQALADRVAHRAFGPVDARERLAQPRTRTGAERLDVFDGSGLGGRGHVTPPTTSRSAADGRERIRRARRSARPGAGRGASRAPR